MKSPSSRGKRKTQDPCEGCGLHRDRCLCAEIPRLDLKTKLSLIIHSKEIRRTTNSGGLAIKALVNSHMLVRGLKDAPLNRIDLFNDGFRPVLFFPSERAVELNAEFVAQDPRPIHLLVPDGNWRQASKVQSRYEELESLPHVMIRSPNLAVAHLRKETTAEGMSTLEAIASAFGVIEGLEVEAALRRLYELKLKRTLEGRQMSALKA